MGRISRRTGTPFDDLLIKHTRRPLKAIIPLIMVYLVLPFLGLSAPKLEALRHILSLFMIASVSWLLVHVLFIAEDVIMSRYDIGGRDNLKARKVYTQVQVFKRVVTVVIGILGFAAMLMTFDKVRQLGTSILASAGVIGIIIGFAAQRTIATIFAGFQIAVAQPIRIDDVVIVEGEWGRIEEITLTYVVVKIWDLRRLIVPIAYFIEKPFQNWTRASAEMLGTVYFYVDYTIPLQEIRNELKRVVESSDLWDGKVCGLVVTNARENTLEIRALISAADSGKQWNLRCLVREKIIEFIQKNYPDALPRVRAELHEPDKGSEDS
ncbi:MAG TPA: mechanosensitive ion channel family protein [Nitrospirae bacterium]|nr:mechanosensitive ion channel family protein [Nitrospirota bacterium]HDO36392.1 mechanosensitive ion channel family protein [Nitrospirota bacterium]HDZ88448.1 mechanosensitive ion channel family protein [Nitrospirota bacterium]